MDLSAITGAPVLCMLNVSFWLFFSAGKLEPNSKFDSQIFREISVSAELAFCQFGKVLWYVSGATLKETKNRKQKGSSFPASLQPWKGLDPSLLNCGDLGLSYASRIRSKTSLFSQVDLNYFELFF